MGSNDPTYGLLFLIKHSIAKHVDTITYETVTEQDFL